MKKSKHLTVPDPQPSITLSIAVLAECAQTGQPLAPAIAAALADVLRASQVRPVARVVMQVSPAHDQRQPELPLVSLAPHHEESFQAAQMNPVIGAERKAECPDEWISSRSFAAAVGIAQANACKAMAACENGKTWRGHTGSSGTGTIPKKRKHLTPHHAAAKGVH
jgi:hypothetical protein